MVAVILTIVLAAVSTMAVTGDYENTHPFRGLQTTTSIPATPTPTSYPLHSIHERAAVLPPSEDTQRFNTEPMGEEGYPGEGVLRGGGGEREEEEVDPDAERDCYRAADIFNRRSSLDKNFMRFGRSGGTIPGEAVNPSGSGNKVNDLVRLGRNFIRFGRGVSGQGSGNNFIRLGRSGGHGAEEGGDGAAEPRGSPNNFMRFGRDPGGRNFIRLGRDPRDDGNFMRLGRGRESDGNLVRFGRNGLDRNFMRFGRGDDTNFMRFGRARQLANPNLNSNFMRLGRSPADTDNNLNRVYRGNLDRNFMRFGRSRADDKMDRVYRANLDRNFMRFGRSSNRNFIRFGRGLSNNFMRFGRSGEEEEENDDRVPEKEEFGELWTDDGEKDFGVHGDGSRFSGTEKSEEKGAEERSDDVSRTKRSTDEGESSFSDPLAEETLTKPYGSSSLPSSPLSAYIFSPELFLIPSLGKDTSEGRGKRRDRSNFIRFG